MPSVLLRLDPASARPVILHEDSEPPVGEAGVRFRFVTEADGESEAAKVGVRGSSHQDEIRESR